MLRKPGVVPYNTDVWDTLFGLALGMMKITPGSNLIFILITLMAIEHRDSVLRYYK